LKTIYAWYQPEDKCEVMNVNDRSLRICSTSLPELLEVRTRKKGHVGALPAMRHPILKQDHPKVGHGYRYENINTPYGTFLDKGGQ
jgi:hypothetical protein